MFPLPRIRRRFADLATGQIHYRHAGPGHAGAAPAIVLFHASPESSRRLIPLIERLAEHFEVFAPDTPGNGDSTPLPPDLPAPSLADYASRMGELLEVIGIERAHLYGSHTGAGIAIELALLAPARVGTVILDGIPFFDAAERVELLARYAHPFPPTLEGDHLSRVFTFCRDMALFYPWYARDRAHRRDCDLPSAAELHQTVLDVLKASESYHLAYRAAFNFRAEERTPLVRRPILAVGSEDDPLRAPTEALLAKLPDARFVPLPPYGQPAYYDRLAEAIRANVR